MWTTTGILIAVLLLYQIARIHEHLVKEATRRATLAESLLEASPAATLILDDHGLIFSANRAAVRLFRCQPDQFIGQHFSCFVDSSTDDKGSHSRRSAAWATLASSGCCAVQGHCHDGTSIAMEMRARRIEQDGRHWTITHLRSLAGENRVKAALSRHVEQLLLTKESLQRHNTNLESIVQDRTEQLRAARDAADRANAAKSEFLSNMSHELRTPLHGVLSFARFGLKRYASAEREKLLTYFQRIESTGQTLLRLLNDLLDLSKLEAGAMTLELEPVDLFAVVSDVAEEFGALAREKRLSIQLPARQAPLQVWGDRARLLQVFRNLFGNAAKFTPEQGEIRVSATRSEGVVQIDVRDTGPGIPDGERQAVFDKFVQSKSAKGGKGGTGLGLAICREIILLHKGTISAEPTDGVGALLRVALPEYVPVAVAIHEDLYSSMAGAT